MPTRLGHTSWARGFAALPTLRHPTGTRRRRPPSSPGRGEEAASSARARERGRQPKSSIIPPVAPAGHNKKDIPASSSRPHNCGHPRSVRGASTGDGQRCERGAAPAARPPGPDAGEDDGPNASGGLREYARRHYDRLWDMAHLKGGREPEIGDSPRVTGEVSGGIRGATARWPGVRSVKAECRKSSRRAPDERPIPPRLRPRPAGVLSAPATPHPSWVRPNKRRVGKAARPRAHAHRSNPGSACPSAATMEHARSLPKKALSPWPRRHSAL